MSEAQNLLIKEQIAMIAHQALVIEKGDPMKGILIEEQGALIETQNRMIEKLKIKCEQLEKNNGMLAAELE